MLAMATTTGAATATDQASSAAPAPPSVGPQPRSPPAYPDLCGRHRLQVEVQLLTREIGVLQDELQSVEGLQSVSSCCKEVHEYVGRNPDPLIPVIKKRDKRCCFKRWLRTLFCLNITWICCSGRCWGRIKRPSCGCRHLDSRCCHPTKYGCPCSSNCCKCSCCSCSSSSSFRSCCSIPRISCPEYSCGCVWSCSKCTEVCLCTRRSCCKSQCLCQWT